MLILFFRLYIILYVWRSSNPRKKAPARFFWHYDTSFWEKFDYCKGYLSIYIMGKLKSCTYYLIEANTVREWNTAWNNNRIGLGRGWTAFFSLARGTSFSARWILRNSIGHLQLVFFSTKNNYSHKGKK